MAMALHRNAAIKAPRKPRRPVEPVVRITIASAAVEFAYKISPCHCRVRIADDRTGMVIVNRCKEQCPNAG